jgi:hypothetical protein
MNSMSLLTAHSLRDESDSCDRPLADWLKAAMNGHSTFKTYLILN